MSFEGGSICARKTYLSLAIYSVVQSDGHRFCGDVVLDSFNIAYGLEDSALTKSMKRKYFGIVITRFKILEVIEENV